MKKNLKINILDCTLRDGGYYNNWDFSRQLTQNYINKIHASGVRNIELGFRALKKGRVKGPNWYTSDTFINSFKIPKEINIGVMVNVFEITSSSLGLEKTVNLLFKKAESTKVRFVRLASHLKEINSAFKIMKILKSKGYLVAVNLMQISEHSKKKVIEIGKKAEKYKPDILYFADSLGSMDENKIKEVLDNLRVYWKGEIGVHAHDNLSKALSNSLFALKNGVNWVDATVLGMGRGPGNVKVEELILELLTFNIKNLKVLPIISLLTSNFNEMKKYYQWGTNLFYYLAGKYGIHPTYIQEMLSQKLSDREILNVIYQLKNKDGNKYDINLIRSEFQKPIKITEGKWRPAKTFKNKEILFISTGESLSKQKKIVENYIKKSKPIVISLKTKVAINKKLIDFYIACNPLRIINEIKNFRTLKKPVIFPATLLTESIKPKLSKVKILDYGIGLKDNKFKFFDNCAYLPKIYNISYALAVVTGGKASKISLAGFDAYGDKDERTKVVNEIFLNYLNNKKSLSIKFITPSSYNFNYKNNYEN
jgi:4-hydroxy 2-oxovalerate aldolase